MAINSNLLAMIERMLGTVKPGSSLMTLGRQTIHIEGAGEQEQVFGSLGFDAVHSLDISDFQGATHLHDLNEPEIPAAWAGRYDVVLTGGTLEHVFHTTNALKAAVDLLRTDGLLIHIGPTNNWIDHGYFQFSPVFFFDFFAENGFGFEHSVAVRTAADRITILPALPGEARNLNDRPGKLLHVLSVRKRAGATSDRAPKQGLYLDKHGDGDRAVDRQFRAFAPVSAEGGRFSPLAQTRFRIDRDRLERSGGAARYPFRNEACPASVARRPFRSPLLVYEDGRLLDWIADTPERVGAIDGAFAHHRGHVHFSARDGSDPLANGRLYELAIQEMAAG